MISLKKVIFSRQFLGLLLIAVGLSACSNPSSSNVAQQNRAESSQTALWTRINNDSATKESLASVRQLNSFATFQLNREMLKEVLRRAPMEFSQADTESQGVMTLPLPNGETAKFRIEESPIMSPGLSEQFPQIKSYRAIGLDDPTAIARIDDTPDGVSAMVISADGDFYVEPAMEHDPTRHVSFFKNTVEQAPVGFECFVKSTEQPENPTALRSERADTRKVRNDRVINDDKIRKYTLAVAVTGEYTAAVHKPDNPQNPDADLVEDAFKAIHKTVNRLNLIFESEVGVRLELVDQQTKIIFTDRDNDPYSNNINDDSTKNQEVLDKIIRSENYDVGHVFTTAAGGAARQPSACDPEVKADAATGRANPTGAAFDIDYVAHEMGHQFGASHSFNGTTAGCAGDFGRVSHAAYEPGSGSTIMSYSGISITGSALCGSETVQHHCDDYFHANSLQEITAFITDPKAGGSCGRKIASSNKQRPVVKGGGDFSIPKNTPFTLTAASGDDGDGDILTYTWEQFDLGEPDPPNPLDPLDFRKIRPIFRSRRGSLSLTRTFPSLADILSKPVRGTFTAESLPVIDRIMTFRVTARDRRGRFGFDDVQVRVVDSAGGREVGPFVVTQPQENAVWKAGSTQVVKWDVAGTRVPPISCTSVRILLLIDGDERNPVVLINHTDNDGEETVAIPSNITLTDKARVKVEAVGNIFFNVSAGDIQITSGG